MPEEKSAAWRAVDQSGNSDDMAAYLERAARAAADLRADSIRELHLSPGHVVLDAGCGTGVAAFEMAALVGDGVVHAIDVSEDMVASVRAQAAATRVEARVGDIRALDLAEDSCDAARTERVLIHLTPEETERAIAELTRVVRPGGRVALVETCHAQCRIDGDDLLLPAAARSVANPMAGLSLRGALLRAGCMDVTSAVRPLVFNSIDALRPVVRLEVLAAAARRHGADEAEISAALAQLEERDRSGTFHAVMIFYLAAATVAASTSGGFRSSYDHNSPERPGADE